MALKDMALAHRIKGKAHELGFDLVGICSAEPSQHGDYLRKWLESGHHGSMKYMADRFAERIDPGVYFPGVSSVICVAMNYYSTLAPIEPGSGEALGRVARYALGDDYHDIIKPRLHQLADALRIWAPEAQTRCAVDTAPILERELAARAGIGWVGKNTCIIHPRVGSWILLGEVLTNLRLPADEPVADHCGACTRCIDACPTGAITEPHHLDASRCVSYLTIEHRDDILAHLRKGIGDWLYGCDICQDVCPHNRQPPEAINASLRARFPTGRLDAGAVAAWDDDIYRQTLRKSAMKRVKLPVLQRNAEVVKANHLAPSPPSTEAREKSLRKRHMPWPWAPRL